MGSRLWQRGKSSEECKAGNGGFKQRKKFELDVQGCFKPRSLKTIGSTGLVLGYDSLLAKIMTA